MLTIFPARPDAVEVSSGLLIGSAPGRQQRKALASAGINLVVDLRDDCAEHAGDWPPEVEVARFPIIEREPPDIETLRHVANWIAERVSVGQRVLVHCHTGVGPSATVVCAVLVTMGSSLTDAQRRLRDSRPTIAHTESQVNLLVAFQRSLSRPDGCS